VSKIKIHVGPGAGIAPRAGMNAGWAHEGAEMKLAAGRHSNYSFGFLQLVSAFGHALKAARRELTIFLSTCF
jgi:hypothetical protein